VAWGNNAHGQCNVPALPSGLAYVEVAAGSYHTLARRSDGTVVAWGNNAQGQCNVPALPSGISYAEVAASEYQTVARRSDGSVVAWGASVGNVPALPSGFTYVDVAAGSNFMFARYEPSCLPVTTYCTAKTTGNGCVPVIGSSGTPSASTGSGFFINATNMVNNKSCLLFYGTTGQAAGAFQGGVLCVKAPIKRTPATSTFGNPPPNDCSGAPSIDMNLFAVGGLGGTPLAALSVPGTIVDCQWWGRDPGFAAPNNTQLTNGVQYSICP
jgi:hypothetical protein